MPFIKDIKEALLHLAFPHICAGCGSDLLDKENELCWQCLSSLPKTDFHLYGNNPIEKTFWGRLPLKHASAQYYFTKESLIQRLMHSFKYKANKELGTFLGNLIGHQLMQSNRFQYVDALVPLPLYPSKERKRGFNQAVVLCEGMAAVMQKPVLANVVKRNQFTETQTKKNRIERWENMEGRFELVNEAPMEGKHILLVDDVMTTGATLEACGRELLKTKDVRLSITTLCFSST